MKNHPRLWLALVGCMTSVALPGSAHACGGFFCNQPQTPTDLPIAQTGENVLFAMDPLPSGLNRLEAHIQIFYTGPADRFSWVVPVDALPTLDIGTNAVFTALDARTRPQLMVTRTREGVCSDDRASGPGFGGASDSTRGGTGNGSGPEEGGVNVAFRGNVGPFDAVVVMADEPMRLKTWLAENNYYLSPEGSRLIDAYVLERKYFVALKLLPGKMVNEIQPIILRFEAHGPCVPLRLTAVASLADLRVNLWVLSRHRVVPENYFEITINEAKFDWLGGGSNYQDLLKTAANEAGGNAFAVEYVGSPSVLAGALVPPAGWDLSRLFPQNRDQAESQLAQIGLGRDPEVQQILDQYYAPGQPPPQMTLAQVIEAKIVKPRVAAQALFDGHAKLTRLVTFISPEEMTIDPTFIENSTLPDVSNVRTANAILQCGAREYSSCDAPMKVVLPDGKSLYFKAPADGGWCSRQTPDDRGALDQMPSLERGWKREATGEGVLRFDNRPAITAGLNAQQRAVLGGCSCSLGSGRVAGAPLALLSVIGLLIARRRWRR